MGRWSIVLAASAAVLVVSPVFAQAQKPRTMTESQARAYCAKQAEKNTSATRQQMWADACVRQVMGQQKKS